MTYYLSYLMGATAIQDQELEAFNIEIIEKTGDSSRKLKIPQEHLSEYIKLVKTKLTGGFWNEIVGNDRIKFLFKFNRLDEYSTALQRVERSADRRCAGAFSHHPRRYAATPPRAGGEYCGSPSTRRGVCFRLLCFADLRAALHSVREMPPSRLTLVPVT